MSWYTTFREVRTLGFELLQLDGHADAPLLPPRPASSFVIAQVERRIGRRLPPSYRALLMIHDGVPDFYQGVSLLGASSLARGTYDNIARAVITFDEDAPAISSVRSTSRPGLVPFAIDDEAETIFAWDFDAASVGAEAAVVVWISGIAERLDGFPSALELVRDMLRSDIDERRAALTPQSIPPVSSFRAAPPERSLRITKPGAWPSITFRDAVGL